MEYVYNIVIDAGKYLSDTLDAWLIVCIAAGVVVLMFLLNLITLFVSEVFVTKAKLEKLNGMCEKQKFKPQDMAMFTKKFDKAAKSGNSRAAQVYTEFLECRDGTIAEAYGNSIISEGYPKPSVYVGIIGVIMSIISFVVLLGKAYTGDFALHLQSSLIFPVIILVLGFILNGILNGSANGVIQNVVITKAALKKNLGLIYKGDVSYFEGFALPEKKHEDKTAEQKPVKEQKLNKEEELALLNNELENLEGVEIKEAEEKESEVQAEPAVLPAIQQVEVPSKTEVEEEPKKEDKITKDIDPKTIENIQFKDRKYGQDIKINLLEASLKFETEKEMLENELKNNRRIYEVKDQEFDDELRRNRKELEIVRNNKSLSKDIRLIESFREQEEILFKRISAIERLKRSNRQTQEEEEARVRAKLTEIDRNMELKRQSAQGAKPQAESSTKDISAKKTVNEMLGDLLESMDKYKK